MPKRRAHRHDVVDPDIGLPRVMSRKCDTCIFRPGNPMHLREGRRESMVAGATANGAWIPCHDTFAEDAQGICRGFYDVHGRDSVGIRLAHVLAERMGLDWPTCNALDPSSRSTPPEEEP